MRGVPSVDVRFCKRCGKGFEPRHGLGRPRTNCYECKPERRKQPEPKVTRADIVQAPHCAYCGAFTSGPDMPFCSPAHRAAFAEKVRAEQERKAARAVRPRYVSGKAGRRPGGAVAI